ncbi:ABC transporter permease, partial [candidate division KSB1 bacterium]
MNSNQRPKKPSVFAEWFLKKIVNDEKESPAGDFEEYYNCIIKEKNKISALIWYISQIIILAADRFKNKIWGSTTMFKNYLKITLRNIKRQKFFSFINIAGLAVGLACCLLMLLWINDELSFDRFHENADVLYRVITKTPSSDQIVYTARTAPAAGAALVEQYPDITNFTRYQCFTQQSLEYNGKSYLNSYFGVADPSFFEMFSFTFISGDPGSVFKDKHSIVITESIAEKYFGDEDPMGKIMLVQISKTPFKVTGVIKDVPETSHMHFECIMPFAVCIDWFEANPLSWKTSQYYTYIQLQNNSNPEEINEKISGIIKEHDETIRDEIFLQPLKDIHLRSTFGGDHVNYKKGDIKYIYIYSITALCVLLIACINFMNLSTARSSRRAKEVGLRKVTGAQKNQLLVQFLGESVILSLFALFFAVILVNLILPTFNDLTGKNLVLALSSNLKIMAGCLGITVLTGVISGIYPAFILSALQPVKALKDLGFKRGSGDVFIRKILVMIQVVLSVILITGTIVVYDQIDYMKDKPLGYDNSYIINTSGYFFARNSEAVKNELLENPDIISISRGIPPDFDLPGGSLSQWEGKSTDQKITMYPVIVDYSYLETFGMTMKEGRFFSEEFTSDNNGVVINETAANVMGLTDPVGTSIKYEVLNFGSGRYNLKEGVIVGVMNDFHQNSLHNIIEPMVFEFSEWGFSASIKVRSDNLSETLTFLEDTWNKYVDYPYSYSFLSEK